MIIQKKAADTLTAFELDPGDKLEYLLPDGEARHISLIDAGAEVIRTNIKELKTEEDGGHTEIRFWCKVEVDGERLTMERECGTQKSFYEPWKVKGLHIWFDAVDDIFEFVTEDHGECRPSKRARFAVHEGDKPICPEPLVPWCPLPENGIKIEDCYNNDDCWMGAYRGAAAHGGLDINHPAGTPLYAPLDLDDHYLFDRVEDGEKNNRWRGFRRWPNGTEWILQAHHMIKILVPEHQPMSAGTHFAEGAGVWVGDHDHSHFVFKIKDEEGTILLDPWILFWQMYRDQG